MIDGLATLMMMFALAFFVGFISIKLAVWAVWVSSITYMCLSIIPGFDTSGYWADFRPLIFDFLWIYPDALIHTFYSIQGEGFLVVIFIGICLALTLIPFIAGVVLAVIWWPFIGLWRAWIPTILLVIFVVF